MLQKYIAISILAATLGYADNADMQNMAQKIKQQNISVVKAAAEGLSQKLPQRIDKFTSLVKIEAQGETLLYTFEIDDPKMSDEEIAKRGRKKMKEPVTHGICTSSKRFLESGIDIAYLYKSARSKKELFRFDVDKRVCNYKE